MVLDHFDNWVVQLRKGIVELCILNALQGREWYGYELVKRLVQVPGLHVVEGTIYPLLSRLRVQGLLRASLRESREGPARKYYALTAKGERVLAQMNDHLELLTTGIDRIRGKGASP